MELSRLNSGSTTLRTLVALAALLTGSQAHATGTTDWTAAMPRQFGVGGVVVVAPKYEGSKDYRVIGFPLIVPSGMAFGETGRVQFRGPDDLRLRVLDFNGFEVGPLLGWRFGRDEGDSRRLAGLGDVDGGFVAGGFVAYRAGAFRAFVSYHRQVSGDDGGALVRFGAEGRTRLTPSLSLLATAGASYADGTYMTSYFSISPLQSAASLAGLPVYDAGSGFKDVFVGLSADIRLAPRWSLKLSGRYARLIGDAADSPIVESENQFTGGIGLTYSFDIGR